MKRKPPDADGLSAGQWKERGRPQRRTFPGPRGASVLLRVSLSRPAYAELTSHAQESLEGEVCGVLAGQLCEDDEGVFVEVQAAVRGAAAREERGHVTFTQETWNAIHASMERDHPKLQIVGWYHTHPGFGVEFSEMDAFIQRNFFSLPSQIALVMDPLGGEVAIGANGSSGLEYLDRFWVDGREHRSRVPAPRAPAGAPPVGAADPLASLEVRISQLVTAVHELRASLQRFLFLLAVGLGLGIALVVGYAMYRTMVVGMRPPENIAFVPVPVTIEGKPALIGVGIVSWSIPRELWPAPTPAEAKTEPVASPSPERAASPAPSPSPGGDRHEDRP